MYLQGKQVRAKVPDLPEAMNPSGFVDMGQNRDFQLMVIGESTMAGVGVKTHEEGFGGELASALAKQLNKNIRWKVYAKNGVTAKRVIEELLPTITEKKVDLIAIGLGGNDAFHGNSPRTWRQGARQIIQQLLSLIHISEPTRPY